MSPAPPSWPTASRRDVQPAGPVVAHPLLKQLERALKRAVFRLVASGFPARRLPPPDWSSRRWRVLYLRHDRIGDMIVATGVFRAIAQSHGTIELDVLASPGNAAVLEGNPHVKRVLLIERKRLASFIVALRALRRGRYDVVIDGMVAAPSASTMLLLLATRAPYRIGTAGRANESVYSLPVPAAGPNASFLEELAQAAVPFGVSLRETDWHADLAVRDDERARAEARWARAPGAPRLLLNVSAVAADRRWPFDRYEALARELRRREPGARLVVTCDPRDYSAAQAVAVAGSAEAVNVSPVREAFALVGAADALVTPDTSLSHAAAALGTPALVMFRGDWLKHMPAGGTLVKVISPGSTLDALGVEGVTAALEPLLGHARARAAARFRPV